MPTPATPELELSFAFAKRHGVLLDRDTPTPTVRYRPPLSSQALLALSRYCQQPLKLIAVDAAQFDHCLAAHYHHDSNEAMQLMGAENDLLLAALPEPEDLLDSQDDAPIIRLLNALFTQAIREQASDIHIEPYENQLSVRFRVDGILREVLQPQRGLGPLLASRIKVMAKLDIAEKRLPQDGRISLRIANRPVDIRVSTLPSGYGERVVLRLLDNQAGRLDLAQLGMSPPDQERLHTLIHKPHGIILVTGPTGSGKTTTLYAALSRLNSRERNILTVEDPIEYYLEGVGQTQVNPKIEMSFARGLRAILRQDPDVVMIGEIRDLETAQIAVQASLTGHLVLSTLHTNSAIGTVTRLLDMGIEPFLLASSLLAVVAQRLVRVLCPHCKQGYAASPADCTVLQLPPHPAPTFYRAVGCEHCNHSGYRGRMGIYELIVLDEHLRHHIHEGAAEQTLERYAHQHSLSIRQDGARLVQVGHTTLEEIIRVTRES